jgi:hypothetical protein
MNASDLRLFLFSEMLISARTRGNVSARMHKKTKKMPDNSPVTAAAGEEARAVSRWRDPTPSLSSSS